MKRFDKLRTILWIMALFFCVLLAIQFDSVFANTELFVNLKDGKTVYKNELLTTELFEFRLGNKTICDVENLEMTPEVFSETGEQFVTFTYRDENVVYMKKLMVSVNSVEPSFLSSEMETVCFVKGQNVTKEQLPKIYVHYNNGERQQITDYSFLVDWDKKKICVSYNQLQMSIAVDVIENKMDYLEVKSSLKCVPESYVFDETDITVMLHYTNGTKENVTDFQIMPYKLVEGYESLVYVTYKEMTGSFKVMATKEIMKETPLPTEQPNYLLPNLSVPQYTPAIDEKETSASEDITMQEGLKTQEPESVEMQEGLGTPEPECTVAPEETKALEPVCTITPVTETKDSEQMVAVPTLNPSQEENLELGKTDTTPPKTNIQNKTYKNDVKICVTDESEIASVVLRGSINKTIKNGYKLTKEGSYQLILKDIYGNAKTVKFKLEKPVKKIKVSYSFTDKWNVMKFQAKATGTSRGVKWSVSNKKIATVDKNGTFKVKKSGTVYLIAKLDKKKVKQKIKIEKKKKSILLY